MQEWTKYGFMGLCIGGLGWFILFLIKGHRAERKEFRELIEKMSDKSDRREDETSKVIRDTGGILQGLKTLLEHRNK